MGHIQAKWLANALVSIVLLATILFAWFR